MKKKGKKKHMTKQMLSLHELFSAGEKPRIRSHNGRAPKLARQLPPPHASDLSCIFQTLTENLLRWEGRGPKKEA